MLRVFTLLTLFVGLPYVHAENDPVIVSESGDWKGVSPNQKHFAALAVRVEDNMIWRKDIGAGMLEVVEPSTSNGKFTENSNSARYGSYSCFDIGDRAGWRAQWSPDSRYLVITTVSLGGHSPWHYNAYLYCADDRSLRYMDDVVGLVVSANFTFVGPHSVQMGVGVFGDFDHPKQVEIDLDQKSRAMKKTISSGKGNLSD